MNTSIEKHKVIDPNAPLQLSPIKLNEDYCKKWNERMTDFVCLTRNGELVNNSLYRLGGFGHVQDLKNDYFMLLKYVEAYYEDHIVKATQKFTGQKTSNRHLAGCWTILNKHGQEVKVFDQFKSPYLIKNSVIYSIDSNYYNIETDEFYCHCSHSFRSDEFLFLDNQFDKDLSRRGVMQIDLKTGEFDLYPTTR